MRKRAEAARRKRIDHVFIKADDNSNGKITPQQMIKLFAANGEVVDAEFESDAKSLAEKDGWILKQSFIKYALNTELCKDDPQEKKEQIEKKTSNSGGAGGTKRGMTRREKPNAGRPIDKVELTFKKFDTNKDGYLSREEFDNMMKDVEKEQADRIFRLAGSERIGGDGRRISLEEFRKMLERDPKSNKKNHPK